jgi:hypothetical protein
LLTLLNIQTCWCADCYWQQVHDVADAIETGNVIVSIDQDAINGLFMSRSGADLLRSYAVLPDAVA